MKKNWDWKFRNSKFIKLLKVFHLQVFIFPSCYDSNDWVHWVPVCLLQDDVVVMSDSPGLSVWCCRDEWQSWTVCLMLSWWVTVLDCLSSSSAVMSMPPVQSNETPHTSHLTPHSDRETRILLTNSILSTKS